MKVPDDLIYFGEHLAEVSGQIIKTHFRNLDHIGEKRVMSPVTIADMRAEEAMRKLISEKFPEHGVVGEEKGNVNKNAKFLWVLDPIDGTKNYASGSYNFGTLIALMVENNYLMGIMNQPVLEERWIGISGHKTTFNGKPVKTRSCQDVSKAWMSSTHPSMFQNIGHLEFKNLTESVFHYLFGSDCIGYGLLANGYIDIVCESQLKFWDYAAHIPIIEGAGGIITDWNGNSLTPESEGDVIACGDKRLHEKVLTILQK